MIKKKLKIGILLGGRSAEHEVSIISAKNVIKALDKDKYKIFPIKINKDGKFNFEKLKGLDVIFPVLHGPFGEDGSMQGFLKILNLPFVGPSVLGSAVGMDKDVMKRLFRDAGIPIGKFVTARIQDQISFKDVSKKLGLPMFIKPANLGSSVGIHKIKNEKEFIAGLKDAFCYDTKIVIEENIDGREIECSVLGNENPIASTPGEIISNADFYSYDSKYIDNKSICKIPADLPKDVIKRVKDLAIEVFKVLNCEGMGRVDVFVKKNGEVIVNEINTLPGFTSISMYPKMWESDGLPITKLLDKLIDLGMERFEREKKLKSVK
ncbi:MAG TPA: D-alanine--D-alanine ligase family protein [Candidatus Paceibacterota bacterium]|nr:D-alanine--D-alanine ligase family protein [Candidatus Paceibacterota bacterium]HPT18122.1 D-alanine--D-alanine ligase family protein [Candidatus Paceibacterota bacterium]